MLIKRLLEPNILDTLNKGKAIIILGPRQVGKTTLLKTIFENNEDVLWLNADEMDVQNIFLDTSSTRLKAIIGSKKFIVIDEAQRINQIGLKLKLITDQIKNVQLVVTESSSFELSNKLNEPLTGRKWEYQMFPLSFKELVNHHGLLDEKRLLPHRLIYGYYPDVVNNQGNEIQIINQLSNSYLYKDILSLDQIKKPSSLQKLLQALSLQIGSQVSYSELSQICGIDFKTIEKYITILEDAYIIFKVASFNRNLRTELKKSKKIYFYDNGIRNSLISNFNQIENRNDTGALWENFLMSERRKLLSYNNNYANQWFWRTTEQKEIDLIEEKDGIMNAYEFKWSKSSKVKISKTFISNYPDAIIKIISRDNFEEFIL